MMGNMRLNKRKEKFNGGLRNNQMIKKDAQYDAKIIAGHDQSEHSCHSPAYRWARIAPVVYIVPLGISSFQLFSNLSFDSFVMHENVFLW
jgi:hypothetical protein